MGRPDIPFRYVYETGCRRIRFGAGVFFVFFCLVDTAVVAAEPLPSLPLFLYSIAGNVLLHDNDRDDSEKFCSARRIDEVDRRWLLCSRLDDVFDASPDELLLPESLEQEISKFEL